MIHALTVLTNFRDEDASRILLEHLRLGRLVSWTHIMPNIHSLYGLEGKFDWSEKVGLQIKTTSEWYVELEREMVKTHPFETRELIAVPTVDSLLSYLNWIKQQTKKELNV